MFDDLELGWSVFAVLGALQPSAEFVAEDLLSVADAEQGFFEREQLAVHLGRFFEQAVRSSRKHDAPRSKSFDACHYIGAVGKNVAVDARLTKTSCDQLGDLAAEVDNGDAVLFLKAFWQFLQRRCLCRLCLVARRVFHACLLP